MPTTLPTLTRTLDDVFTTSWYDIKTMAIDNILDGTPVWAALKDAGCFKTQRGGIFITETIRHGEETATAVKKGTVLPQGEPELETMARWTWKYCASHVQRSIFDDQQNAGPSKIKDYVQVRMGAAREAITQKYEANAFGTHVSDEVTDEIQSLNDVVAPQSGYTAGTYGAISRSNSWWQSKYKQFTTPVAVNLLDDMKNLYNTISNNQEPPNLLICDQDTFEIYEQFALDQSQLIKETDTRLADLGYDVLRFKGKRMIWTNNVQISSTRQMLMLNTNYIKVIYDPAMWFDMTNWKDIPLQGDRIAHIVSAMNIISNQLRRHGRLYA